MASISGSVLFSSTSASSGGAGVSNIPIVLQNTSTSVGAIVLTNASGFYQFDNVPNGNYRIVEAYGVVGGTASPKDFSGASVITQPTPKDPDVSAISSPPANTTKITSLSPNTIFVTMSGSNITGQDFRDNPQRNIPLTINDMNLVASNLVTVADNGSFGSNTAGTAKNTYPATTPYSTVVTGFNYVAYGTNSPSDGNYTLINLAVGDVYSWLNMPDHTTGDETGRYIIVNGASPGAIIFKQTFSDVKINTFYMLSVWIANLNKSGSNGLLPSLGVRVKTTGNVQIFNRTLSDIAEPAIPTWNQVSTVLNTQSNTTIILEIYSNGNAGGGNDYAIDDVQLQECVVNPNLITTSEFVDKSYADVGDTITYTTVIRNGGNSTTNIVIKDAVQTGTSFVAGSMTINGATIPAATIVPSGYNTGISLTNGQVLTVSYKVLVNTLPSPSVITNIGITDYDFLPVPGGVTVTPTVKSNSVSTTINYGSIYTVKTANKTNVGLGDTLNYTLLMKNIGSTTVRNVVVTSTIPTGTILINNSLDYDGTNIPGAIPTLFNIGTIAVNEPHIISYKVQVTTVPGISTITNSATVTFNYVVDPSVPAGKNTSINTAILSNYAKYPSLSVSKSINKQYFTTGETATYTVVINNTGTATAKNIILQDTLPDENTFVTNSVYINGTLTVGNPSYLNIGSITAGGRSTVTFKVLINS